MKKIYACRDVSTFTAIASFLKEHGFHPSELESAIKQSAGDSFDVQLPDDEYISAKEVLLKRGYINVL